MVVCPDILSTGICKKNDCTLNHDVLICRPCGVVCYSARVYQAHIVGRPHMTKLSGRSTIFHCTVCNINIQGVGWAQHVAGKPHNRLAARQGVSPNVEPEEEATMPGFSFCNVCSLNVKQPKWEGHLSSAKHVKKMVFANYEAAFEEAEKNKHGINASHAEDGVDFGIVEVSDAQQGVEVVLEIKNTVPLSKITLTDAKLASNPRRTARSFDLRLDPMRSVTYGRTTRISVVFRQTHGGRYYDRIELLFEDTTLHQSFIIVRQVKAIVGSQADYDLLKPKAPYVPRKRTPRDQEVDVVPGVPPPALHAVPYVVKLPGADIPKRVAAALSRGSVANQTTFFRSSILPQVLDGASYGRYMKTLLWIEEFRMEHDLQVYDIPDARLKKHNQYYYLDVPGLAEKRPSVLVGDRILVQPHGSDKGRWFEGHVHVVHKEEVGLCFHGSFKHYEASRRYNARFKLNRIPLRRQHQALDTAFNPDRLLFPTQQHIMTVTPPNASAIRPYIYNSLVVGNPSQLQAVTSIATQSKGAPSFVIFGPPGTGKTITMVEAIRQILRVNPQARILACAPSNSAADLIATRLTMLSNAEMFRFYAPSRYKNQVPDTLRSYTYMTSLGHSTTDHFSVPPMATLKRYRVIVSTCVSASFAYGVGMPRGHFTHIFVDEAGQATEPEAMIALRTMADNDTNVVLSGDPKQLGPIIRSAVARELGHEKSYIERLMERGIYDHRHKHGISVVKLVKNFRSHKAILQFPNDRFYGGELEPCADKKVTDAFLSSSILIARKFPIIVHAISGKDDREASSPSFFNIDEALQVKSYVQLLRSRRDIRITDDDIGIIAPYNAQCRKIKTTLRGMADGIKVGSVEEFQGQERRVIIISTVRSSREFVAYDLRHTLGFVANPRRFNVAVTRAQALLIVVGDPEVLSLDPLWRSFLNYAYEHGGWTGNEPTWDTHVPVQNSDVYDSAARDSAMADMNEFARRMEQLTLDGATVSTADDEGDAHVDMPWREVE